MKKFNYNTSEWLQGVNPEFLRKQYAAIPKMPKKWIAIHERAKKLTADQLDELTRSVGISFGLPKAEYFEDKMQYLLVLNEADDIQKVYDFLEKHGV